MTFNFWQDITITDIKKTFCYVCFFGKNEACVECGTGKRHNPNLVMYYLAVPYHQVLVYFLRCKNNSFFIF